MTDRNDTWWSLNEIFGTLGLSGSGGGAVADGDPGRRPSAAPEPLQAAKAASGSRRAHPG